MKVISFYKPNEMNGYLSVDYECHFFVNGLKFNSVSQFISFYKAITFKDEYRAAKILNSSDLNEIKEIAKNINTNNDDKTWNAIKQIVYYKANLAKFSQNEYLKKQLLETNDIMIAYCNKFDKTLGIGLYGDDTRIYKTTSWQGLNLLGYTLMQVRETLKETN